MSGTAEVLLDAAEVAFAERGVDEVSLRSIMRAVGANPAAVHYHFGSREGLADSVLDRILEPLQARRVELLEAAIDRGRISVESLVDALIRPDFEAVQSLHGRNPGAVRLIGTIYSRPSDFVRSRVEASFAPVAARFMPHLSAVLPGISPEDVSWRIRWFVFGPLGALLSDDSAGEIGHDIEPHVERMVRTMCGALTAKESRR